MSRIDDVSEDGTFTYKYSILGAERYRVEARTVVESDSGKTEFLETDSTEFEVQDGAIDDVILGMLLAWTEFTDGPYGYTLEGQIYGAGYTTGNLGKGWTEGDDVPARLTITGLTSGSTYTVQVQHDYFASGNSAIAYDNFNTPTAVGASLFNITYDSTVATGGDRNARIYNFSFTANSATVELNWFAQLGSNASLWSGATVDFRLYSGIGGESSGDRTVTIQTKYLATSGIRVEKICTDDPSQSFEFTLLKKVGGSFSPLNPKAPLKGGEGYTGGLT